MGCKGISKGWFLCMNNNNGHYIGVASARTMGNQLSTF